MKISDVHPKIPHVTALIAVHNRLLLTQRCVACLRTAAGNAVRLEVVVVDDGSNDGTSEWLAGQAGVTILRGDGNLWFGGAMDLGLRHLSERTNAPDFVLLLNNDSFLRPEALSRMIAEASASRVVATAYWTEDKRELCTTGYVWRRWNGLVDVSYAPGWPGTGTTDTRTVPVNAISTTVVLVPFPLLQKTSLPDPQFHPHHRYDAVLSARLRNAGADFVCFTEVLADHSYGAPQSRPSVRMMRLGRFWRESFCDPRSIWHLRGGLALAWETAPAASEAVLALVKRLARFCRQLAWVSLNSLRPQRAGAIKGSP